METILSEQEAINQRLKLEHEKQRVIHQQRIAEFKEYINTLEWIKDFLEAGNLPADLPLSMKHVLLRLLQKNGLFLKE